MFFFFLEKGSWEFKFLVDILKYFLYILKVPFSHPQNSASNSKKVFLRGLTLKSTGLYRCEVSAEEPDFKTVTGEGRLEVICKYETYRDS